MKAVLIAGDTLNFKTRVPKYPANEGWTLTYKLIPRTVGVVITFNATTDPEDNEGYLIQVGPSVTSAWVADGYAWVGYVHKTGERYTVDQGTVRIAPDPATSSTSTPATYDNRTHARIALDAIEAVIEKRATRDQMAYTIGQRQLSRMPIKDLLMFRNSYREEVRAEEQNERREAGLPSESRLLARL